MQKPVKGFEELYLVSDNGEVFSTKNNIVLKPNILRSGYCQYSLYKNGKRHLLLGHRIVAEAFIPNPNNYPIINHKDECKTNNNVENLEWCTHSYNLKYGTLRERRSLSKTWVKGVDTSKKPVIQMLDGKVIEIYESISEAARKTNTNLSNISQCCLGNRKRANGFYWKFGKEKKYVKTAEL